MAVFSIHVFRPTLGRGLDLLGQMGRAKTILDGLGARCSVWSPVTGGDAGTFSFVQAFDGPSSYGRTMDALEGSDEWQALVVEIITAPTGSNLENYVLSDLDATQGLPTTPATVLFQIAHRTLPGRANDHMAAQQAAVGHLRRMGTEPRTMRSVGRNAGAISTLIGFEDFTHYGEFSEKIEVDEQWAGFMADLERNTPVEEVESGVARLVALP